MKEKTGPTRTCWRESGLICNLEALPLVTSPTYMFEPNSKPYQVFPTSAQLAFILYNTSMVYLAAYKAVDLILIPAMPGALYLAQHSLHDDVVGHIPSDCNLPGPDWLSKYRASPAETA